MSRPYHPRRPHRNARDVRLDGQATPCLPVAVPLLGAPLPRLLACALTSVAFFVGAGELLTRELSIIDRLNGIPRLLYLATNVPDLPYRLRPGVTVHVRDFTVRVNRLGLRGAETP